MSLLEGGRVAFVTGGASGIGLALCRALAERGLRVFAADCDPVALASIHAPGIEPLALDVTDRDAFARAVSGVVDAHGAIDLLVNNAGVGIGGELCDMRPDDWKRVFDVNVFGVVHGIDAAFPHMRRQGGGHIVNVSSVAGLVPLPAEGVYVASKHAVVGLTRVLELEAARYGVDVTLVCPGVVRTPIYETSPVVGYDKAGTLSLWPKGVAPEDCAADIVRAIEARRPELVVTRFARGLAFMHRTAPRAFARFARGYLARLQAHRRADRLEDE